MIITIGRQLGSGGREIGKKLADAMRFAFYDKELLEITANESGISLKLFEQTDEQPNKGLPAGLFGMRFPFWTDSMVGTGGLTHETLFQIQSDVIRNLAAKQSCVFIGRCADYILRDRTDCLNVFICADDDDRMRRIIAYSGDNPVNTDKAREIMSQIDKRRASYYNYYSNKTWGVASSYHICLNSSVLGIDGAVDLLKEIVEK